MTLSINYPDYTTTISLYLFYHTSIHSRGLFKYPWVESFRGKEGSGSMVTGSRGRKRFPNGNIMVSILLSYAKSINLFLTLEPEKSSICNILINFRAR